MKWKSIEQRREYYRRWRETHRKERRQYERKYYHKHLSKYREYAKKYQKNHRKEHLANVKLNQALVKGKIKKLPCAICQTEKAIAHHPNYNKPLEVIWLCKSCHEKLHLLFKT